MSNAVTEKLVAVEAQQGVSLNFIGSLMWYTISDCKVSKDELQGMFLRTGISFQHLPRSINHRDAFRRATRVAEANRVPAEKGRHINYLVREVKMDEKELIRTITREVVDANNERLEYTEIVKLRLSGDNLSVEPSAAATPGEVDNASKVVTVYHENMEHYDGSNMRTLVKNLLYRCDPVSVRPSGGVYYTPVKHEQFVQAIKSFINELEQFNVTVAGKSQAWTIPVVDASEQRAMVKQSLEDQMSRESQSLINEMAEIIKGGKPFRQKTAQGYIDRVKDLRKMVTEYEESLEFQAISAKSALEIAMKQAVILLEKAE